MPRPLGTRVTREDGASPTAVGEAQYDTTWNVAKPVVGVPAEWEFGPSAVEAAKVVADYVQDVAFSDDLVASSDPNDLLAVSAEVMTPDLARDLRKKVAEFSREARAAKPDGQQFADLFTLAFFDEKTMCATTTGTRPAGDGPLFINPEISSIRVKVVPNWSSRLAVEVKSSAALRVQDRKGTQADWELSRDCVFHVTKVGGRWRIDYFKGTYQTGDWPFEDEEK